MNKQQLAQKIWASANQMRSKIEANEYKDYILGFIFYKYLSDKEVKFLKENDYDNELLKTVSEEDAETVEWIQKNIGYFIAYKDLFSTWLTMGKDFDVSNVRDALSAFSRLISNSHKRVFEKVFDTLQTGLSKLGDSSGSQTKAISGLLTLIKDIPMDGKQDYDVLGFIYEYLISNFAANAGKKAGEFYTPHEVSLLMSEIVASHLKGKSEIKIYDPTSGSGSLLINIGQSVAKYMSDDNNIQYYAQELKENTYNLTRMNLVMRGIDPANIITRNGDTLEEDWPYFDENDPVNTYNPLYVDAVVSNPPYVPTAVMDDIPREVAEFEPALALDGGADGLDVLRRLLPWCRRALKGGGGFAFELHETCLDEAARLAEYNSVEATRGRKEEELANAFTKATATAHLTCSLGFDIDANDAANRNVSGLVTLMEAEGAPENLQFCDYNNEIHTVTLTDLHVMQQEIIANGSALYARKWALRDAINIAATTEELNAITISF